VPDETQPVTHWSPADWAALVESGIRRTYLPGQYLLRQGDDGSWIVALIKGRVRVTYHAASGSEVLLAIRGPGDLLGEFGYGDREPRSASVIAIEPCMGSLVTDSRFTAWMATHQNHRRLDRYILAKTREAAKVTWQLARCRPAQRLASLLLAVVTAGHASGTADRSHVAGRDRARTRPGAQLHHTRTRRVETAEHRVDLAIAHHRSRPRGDPP
jgi:CRP/FNR family cyclic AMP-dependent transcriptional regulator